MPGEDPIQKTYENRPQATFKEQFENNRVNQNTGFWAAAAEISTRAPVKSAGTLFYTRCAAGPLIYKRAAIYEKKIRDSDAYQWLYKKIAYAEVVAGDMQLKTRNEEGLSSAKNKNSLYTVPPAMDETNNELNYSAGPRFLPKPHLVSVKTEYKGDFGSVQSCQVAFTVYSLDQLSACQDFFQINQTLSAEWGWENAGPAGGKPVTFTGQIVNFSWSINGSGGADCTSTAIGKGVNTLSMNASMTATKNNKISTYKSGVAAAASVKIVTTLLDELVANAPPPKKPASLKDGLTSISKFNGWHGIDSYDKMSNPMTYCTLEKLISVINTKISEVGFSDIKYRIGSQDEGGICKIPNPGADPKFPTKTKPWASANPLECIFPGLETYYTSNYAGVYNQFAIDTKFFALNQTTSIGNILLNVSFLSSILDSLGTTTDKGEKSASKTLNDFFKKIFTSINLNSGGVIKISTATNSKIENKLTEVLIIDAQYIPEKPEIDPVVIPAVSENSICRTMSLSAKIPSELTSAASVASTSGAGSVTSDGIKPFTKFNSKKILKATGNQVVDDQAAAEIQKEIDKNNATIKNLKDEIKAIEDNLMSILLNHGTKEYKLSKAAYDNTIAAKNKEIANLEKQSTTASNALNSPLELIGARGPNADSIADARAYLKSIGVDKNYSVVYPLDFSFTIDGIAGIKFGDAVTSNYMPAVYRTNSTRCAFTVLNVSHEISGGDWTTSCTTVFRVRP